MEKQQVIDTLKKVKQNSNKRNFKQSIELIINLKGLNLKKQDNQLTLYSTFHYSWGKPISVCAFVGPELKAAAESVCNETILADDFPKFKDKKMLKQLARKHDFFIDMGDLEVVQAMAFYRLGKYSSAEQADPDNATYHLNQALYTPYTYTDPQGLMEEITEYLNQSSSYYKW